MLVRKAFKYRIYPTAEQATRLAAWEDALRWLWNLAHEQRKMGLAHSRKRFYTAFDQINELKALRKEAPWIADVPRNVCAQLLIELDKAWQRCFQKLARKPSFKKKGRDSVSLCEPHPKQFRFTNAALVFPKLGSVRAVLHRPTEGTPKTCSVVRDGDAWFAAIVCELEVADPVQRPGVVALDRGVVNLVADSSGRVVMNPRAFERSRKRLARAQRSLARKKKGGRNREKAKHRVARIFRKVRRQRDHILHTETSRYAKNHGTVIVESLKVRSMTRSARGTVENPGKNVRGKAGLNRAILDSSWSRFAELLRYKLVWEGGKLVEVPAAYSSQTCAACGHVASENRKSQELFVCGACGHRANADVNAAKVLFSRGTHGGAGCGGSGEVSRPAKQQLRVVRRGTRHGSGAPKASAFRPG